MKEDILEQLVDDSLQAKGFFTRHNEKFKPASTHLEFSKRDDSVHSDVDVIGFHPGLKGVEQVCVVSCKSWQLGFNPKAKINVIENDKWEGGREAWRGFRELTKAKWGDALVARVEELTGSTQFTYITAVTKLIGERTCWQEHARFRTNLHGNPIKILTLVEIMSELYKDTRQTTAPSEVGRLLQVIRASGWTPEPPK